MKAKVFNIGSCNGCDIEVWAWAWGGGHQLVDDPEEADLYLVTGSLTAKNAERLEEMAPRCRPKPVVLIGACAASQRLFRPAEADLDGFEFLTKAGRRVVFGCPPSPEEIAAGTGQLPATGDQTLD